MFPFKETLARERALLGSGGVVSGVGRQARSERQSSRSVGHAHQRPYCSKISSQRPDSGSVTIKGMALGIVTHTNANIP